MHIWLHLGREEKGVRTRVCVSELNTRDRLGILHPSTRENQNLFIPVQEMAFLENKSHPQRFGLSGFEMEPENLGLKGTS